MPPATDDAISAPTFDWRDFYGKQVLPNVGRA